MEQPKPTYLMLPPSLWAKVKAKAKSNGINLQFAAAQALREWLASK